MRELKIGQKVINDDSDCYVIAEVGHNHQGDLETAKKCVDAAVDAGCDAVKLQKRCNKELFTNKMFSQPYDNRNSYGATYGEHREFLEFGIDEYKELKDYCGERNIDFFATAFDIPSADFLAELGVPAFKIASGDLRSIQLIKHVASFGLPTIVSTGGASFEDVQRVYETIHPINPNLCIMQCTAGYPPKWEELNLKVIETFRESFPEAVIGLSSHDSGIAMAVASYVLGARVVEKHFTLNRALKGTDHAFSLEPAGMKKMVRDLKRTRLALGDGVKAVYQSETAPIRKMSKSLVAARKVSAGNRLTLNDVRMKSPGGEGLPPYELDSVLDRVVSQDIEEDQPLSLELFS